MKLLLPLLLCLCLPALSRADDVSHRAAASKILEMVSGPEIIRAAFVSVTEPALASMQAQGAPAALISEVRAAITQWFDEEIKWEDIKAKIVEIYVKEFSEQELTDLANFYQSPTGKKALAKLPSLLQQGAQIGQQYAMTKQDLLEKKIQAIVNKYDPAAKTPAAPVR